MKSDTEMTEILTEHAALKQRYTRAVGCFANLVEQARRDHRIGNAKHVGQDLDALAEAVARFAEPKATAWAVPQPKQGGSEVQTWKRVFRQGVVPLISTPGLRALLAALEADDPRLIQGATTSPPPLHSMLERSVEGACSICFCAWVGDGVKTVGEVEEFFGRVCFEIDQVMGEAKACQTFLNWFDDTPRIVMRQQLIPEVRMALNARRASDADSAPLFFKFVGDGSWEADSSIIDDGVILVWNIIVCDDGSFDVSTSDTELVGTGKRDCLPTLEAAKEWCRREEAKLVASKKAMVPA